MQCYRYAVQMLEFVKQETVVRRGSFLGKTHTNQCVCSVVALMYNYFDRSNGRCPFLRQGESIKLLAAPRLAFSPILLFFHLWSTVYIVHLHVSNGMIPQV